MARRKKQVVMIDMLPVIECMGLPWVLDRIGMEPLLETITPGQIIQALTPRQIIDIIGVDAFLKLLTPAQRRELKRQLGILPGPASAARSLRSSADTPRKRR